MAKQSRTNSSRNGKSNSDVRSGKSNRQFYERVNKLPHAEILGNFVMSKAFSGVMNAGIYDLSMKKSLYAILEIILNAVSLAFVKGSDEDRKVLAVAFVQLVKFKKCLEATLAEIAAECLSSPKRYAIEKVISPKKSRNGTQSISNEYDRIESLSREEISHPNTPKTKTIDTFLCEIFDHFGYLYIRMLGNIGEMGIVDNYTVENAKFLDDLFEDFKRVSKMCDIFHNMTMSELYDDGSSFEDGLKMVKSSEFLNTTYSNIDVAMDESDDAHNDDNEQHGSVVVPTKQHGRNIVNGVNFAQIAKGSNAPEPAPVPVQEPVQAPVPVQAPEPAPAPAPRMPTFLIETEVLHQARVFDMTTGKFAVEQFTDQQLRNIPKFGDGNEMCHTLISFNVNGEAVRCLAVVPKQIMDLMNG